MQIPVSLLFLTFILAEIAGFILVGQAIGVLATLGLVLFADDRRQHSAASAGSRHPLQGRRPSSPPGSPRPNRWRRAPS